jgi:hypothetical protein
MSTYLGRALLILGFGFILSIAGIIVLAVTANPIPDVLQNLAVGSMGMIGALLARAGGDDSRDATPPGGP